MRSVVGPATIRGHGHPPVKDFLCVVLLGAALRYVANDQHVAIDPWICPLCRLPCNVVRCRSVEALHVLIQLVGYVAKQTDSILGHWVTHLLFCEVLCCLFA